MNSMTLELSQMQAGAGQACKLMKVLANADRLMILCQLSQGEKRVGELEELLGIVQPTLSPFTHMAISCLTGLPFASALFTAAFTVPARPSIWNVPRGAVDEKPRKMK